MPSNRTLANLILSGDSAALADTRGIIRLKCNNLVERPWGGLRMLDYKGCAPLPDQKKLTGMGVGEAFEVAACPSDPESNAYPSQVCLTDGSEICLHELLDRAGRDILGPAIFEQFKGEIPLLPKTLDIEELLSVQAHPPGNTELYVIIDAEPGASIRLGFSHSVDAGSLRQHLVAGRQRQERLLALLSDQADHNALQDIVAPAFANRAGNMRETIGALRPMLAPGSDATALPGLLEDLKTDYWHVLDLMNEVMVRPGQIIHNANPARVCAATGQRPSAEVHALGNPERREILMLEIRRPGVTFRAWDNVRFPVRDINIDQTLDALNLGATSPAEFEVQPRQIPGSPGVFRSVTGDNFIVDNIRPQKDQPVLIDGGYFHTLHAIRGRVSLTDPAGNATILAPGQSAIAPASLDTYRVVTEAPNNGDSVSDRAGAEVIRVSLPDA